MIELAILGLLREQELHGYELKKRIAEVAGARASFGSLYPALARLEAAGAVKAVEAATSARPVPHTGSLSGEASVFRTLRRPQRGTRGKKSYGITEEGERLFEELLVDPASDDKVFRLKVAFCGYLPSDRRNELFRRRRAQLVQQAHTAMSPVRRRAGSDRLDAYLRLLREHDHESVEREIAWLDRLITAEHTGTHDPAGDADPQGEHHP